MTDDERAEALEELEILGGAIDELSDYPLHPKKERVIDAYERLKKLLLR